MRSCSAVEAVTAPASALRTAASRPSSGVSNAPSASSSASRPGNAAPAARREAATASASTSFGARYDGTSGAHAVGGSIAAVVTAAGAAEPPAGSGTDNQVDSASGPSSTLPRAPPSASGARASCVSPTLPAAVTTAPTRASGAATTYRRCEAAQVVILAARPSWARRMTDTLSAVAAATGRRRMRMGGRPGQCTPCGMLRP